MTFMANDLHGVVWTKARRSHDNGACVEVGQIVGLVAVRDSKDPQGPALGCTPREWNSLVEAIKKGEFDHFASV